MASSCENAGSVQDRSISTNRDLASTFIDGAGVTSVGATTAPWFDDDACRD
jgi:hypothetical protein